MPSQPRVERSSVTHSLKVAVAHALYYTGFLFLWKAIVLRRKAVVLMYHRVLTPEERQATGSHPGIVVDMDAFARQMAVLKRRFEVLALDEFTRRMEQCIPFPSSACLITFDDGWEDNFRNGLPVLCEHRLPALVFLPINYIGRRRLFLREALAHVLVPAVEVAASDARRRGAVQRLLAPLGLERVLDAPANDPRPGVTDVLSTRTGLQSPEMEPLLSALCTELGVRLDDLDTPDTFMNWDEVAAMAQCSVAFGGHGLDHRLLTHIPADEARREIEESYDLIRQKFSSDVPTFSYPNGNWSPAVAAQVKEAGYRLAFTTMPGFVSCSDDRFAVRRINIHGHVTDSTPMFLARVVGLL